MTPQLPPARRGPWILALDVGSSSVRAQWVDAAGAPLFAGVAARAEYAWRATPDGGMEADADALADLCIGVIDVAMQAGRAAGIAPAAVAMAAFWHGLAGIGADGRAVTPLYGWGDGRARAAADVLRSRLDEGGRPPPHRVLSARAVSGGQAGLARAAPRAIACRPPPPGPASASCSRCGCSASCGRRCRWRAGRGCWTCTGRRGTARCWTPPASPRTRCRSIGDAPFAGLRKPFAARWPELAAIPWFPALGDGACASLGMGAVGPRIGLTVGTSAAVRVLREDAEPAVPDGLWCYRLDARRTVCGRAISNGGNGLRLAARGRCAFPRRTSWRRASRRWSPGRTG